MRVAIVPARGGSKRIPRKNIRPLLGRPLISWTLDSLLLPGFFDRVFVSTDDLEIAQVAREVGAEVPNLRPRDLADDFASTESVMGHAVKHLLPTLSEDTVVCCVYPAAIAMERQDYDAALELLQQGQRPYVASVVRYSHPIHRALSVGKQLEVDFVFPEYAEVRSQDLPIRWHDAGQFYWGHIHSWRKCDPILANAVGFEVPAWRAQDIDNEDDWKRAETLLRFIRSR
jgi:pseudaminic acid cytidylyltransferase